MLTDAQELREHLKHMRRRQRIARLTDDPDGRLWWLNPYIKALEIRLERAEQRERRAA